MKKIDEIDLHINICWNAINEVLENPDYMNGMTYDDFCILYRGKLVEYIWNIKNSHIQNVMCHSETVH